jgi:hypothetical protein
MFLYNIFKKFLIKRSNINKSLYVKVFNENIMKKKINDNYEKNILWYKLYLYIYTYIFRIRMNIK